MNRCASERECHEHCRSQQHGMEICSVVTRRQLGDELLAGYLQWLCCSCGQVSDYLGRTALHMAASCGRYNLARWLLQHASANVNVRDLESGYTPLHRSIFYGQLHIASLLIQMGASVTAMDFEHLTPLDIALKDRLPFVDLSLRNPCEVYVWGSNSNYTLGTGNQQNRSMPELLETFRKQDISIKQVAMHKYHSVFLSHDGSVYSCGHGQGGRLGQGTEQASLSPKPLKFPESKDKEMCTQVAIGRDHTVLLMENGSVWTCGLNAYHQLGHMPPPPHLLSPREVPQRYCRLPGSAPLRGVCAGRFHTVMWGEKGLLTCGLHAGQLGHVKSPEHTVLQPRLVSAMNHKECEIILVAASDGATVVATKKGDVYVLHEYQCRKIASRQLGITKLSVIGGHLDAHVDSNVLMDKGGEELKVAALSDRGTVLVWQESAPQLSRCIFVINRPLEVADFVANRSQLLFVTKDGEAFEGEVKMRKGRKNVPDNNKQVNGIHEEPREFVKIRRLPHVHRGVSVASDVKGRNFAIIQVHPKAALLECPQVTTNEMKEQMLNLLQTAHSEDLIHDVIFQVGVREFPAHQYIVALSSDTLLHMIKQEKSNDDNENNVPHVKIKNIRPEIFEQILQFLYTSDCDLLKPGPCSVEITIQESKENSCRVSQRHHDVFKELDVNDMENTSAFSVYTENKQKKKIKATKEEIQIDSEKRQNPVRLAQEASKKLGILLLYQKLQEVRYEAGYIHMKNSIQPSLRPRLFYNKYQDLFDVKIKCEDGQELPAHKCVLAARLQFFAAMFSNRWLGSLTSSSLNLPVPYKVLEVLVHYLYEDEAPAVLASEDIDFICNTLVLANQLFATRLLEICEVALANLVTLRNVAGLLQLADTHQANQLKQCCLQYICLNLSAVLESRSLEAASDNILEELSKYYCELNPALCKRIITPYSSAPTEEVIQSIVGSHPFTFDLDKDPDSPDTAAKKLVKSTKKKIRIRKISEGGKLNERSRNESISSNASYNSDDGDTKGVHLMLENLTEIKHEEAREDCLDSSQNTSDSQSPKNTNSSSWVKITGSNKHQRIIKARLKAISCAQEISTENHGEAFEKLVSNSQHSAGDFQEQQKTVIVPHIVRATDNLENSGHKMCENDFPELCRSPPQHESHFVKSGSRVSEIRKITKVSQKQLKKQAESGTSPRTEPMKVKLAWNSSDAHSDNSLSLTDIMREEVKQNRHCTEMIPAQNNELPRSKIITRHTQEVTLNNPWTKPVSVSPDSPKFCDIIADERKQRENWTKMRAKPLELTQLEDRAIEDLLAFYNATESTDEHISVRRVITDVVAAPVWITSQSHGQ
ncbi:inhibitor of Bruton tyrosine kinase [Schistocerca nitens]|uniref:inhibitor of Bruton tyrosine kinase n=1 Tax=Schistocerca nitens TaxID=7011 RepID=UPI002117F497|nr:inhibitor of Bruton tyrosine kinase [Schistocerca nitens]